MRVTQEEMDRHHRRIVEGAARLLREQGLDNTSVSEAMEAAGLTHGGFYRHFETKDALNVEALEAAFAQQLTLMERHLHGKDPQTALTQYHNYYLSDAHLGRPGAACPVAMLAGDVARATPALKEQFGRGVRQVIDTVAAWEAGTKKEREQAAMREFALLVGAAIIARASDPETAKAVLAACRPMR